MSLTEFQNSAKILGNKTINKKEGFFIAHLTNSPRHMHPLTLMCVISLYCGCWAGLLSDRAFE